MIRKNTLFLSTLLIIGYFSTNAQTPNSTKLTDNFDVQLQKLELLIDIIGNTATTKTRINLVNNSAENIESKYAYPLPSGAILTQYAIIINGNLRQAVPISRSETIASSKNIRDKNTTEEASNPKNSTVINTAYSLAPNEQQTIEITYEQALISAENDTYNYELPFVHHSNIPEFKLTINSYQNENHPQIVDNPDYSLAFSKHNDYIKATLHKSNFNLKKPLIIKIVANKERPTVVTQEHTDGNCYFMLNYFHSEQDKSIAKKDQIGIIWDNSISGLERDITRELELLGAFITERQNLTIDLVLLNITYKKVKTFSIKNGEWHALKQYLENITYDGGTDFSQIKEEVANSEVYLFFTDGISSFGSSDLTLKKPVYIITSNAASIPKNIKSIYGQKNGKQIDLYTHSIKDALSQLNFDQLSFLGFKELNDFNEVYASIPATTEGFISVAGISKNTKNRQITLLFGRDNKVEVHKTISFNYEQTALDVSRIWAQHKIASLDRNYDKNRKEIESIGRQFGMATRNTSLVILDNLIDYIKYDIVPPRELTQAYDSLKSRRLMYLELRKNAYLESAISTAQELEQWWESDFTVLNKYAFLQKKAQLRYLVNLPELESINDPRLKKQISFINTADRQITGIVKSAEDESPLSEVKVSIKNRLVVVNAATNGNYSIHVPQNSSLVFERLGYKTTEVKIGDLNNYNVSLPRLTDVLDEINIIALPKQTNRFNHTPNPYEIKPNVYEISTYSDVVFLPNLENTSQNLVLGIAETKSKTNDYLSSLFFSKNSYQTYLELRPKYLDRSNFYLDVASHLHQKGESEQALLVLSTLTKLDRVRSIESYRSVAYKLKEFGNYKKELLIAKKILEWTPMNALSHRDYALALLDNNKPQEAVSVLYSILDGSYAMETIAKNKGIDEIVITEINHILSRYKKRIANQTIEPELIIDFPVDIRVVLNGNQQDSTLNLWIIDPRGETINSYSHKTVLGEKFNTNVANDATPKQFILKKAIPGRYYIATKFSAKPQQNQIVPRTVMAEIYINYNSGREKQKVITLQDMQNYDQELAWIGHFDF